MGVFIKNADNNLKQTLSGNEKQCSFLQSELLSILGEIWNNQDNLNEKDKEKLIKMSKKSLYE
jgi:hypothetical protein